MRAPRLLLLTPPVGPLDELRRALEAVAGNDEVAVLLRRPGARDRQLLTDAAALAGPVPLLVHRRPDLAKLVGAAGVHLPERGLPIADVRRWLGAEALIGVSRHDRAGLAASAGADYATLSPFFAVAGKNAPLGPEGFRRTREGAPDGLQVLALGGIGPVNAAQALDAGADGVAALRSAREAKRLLDTVRARRG